jgi:hypothetical protein
MFQPINPGKTQSPVTPLAGDPPFWFRPELRLQKIGVHSYEPDYAFLFGLLGTVNGATIPPPFPAPGKPPPPTPDVT